MSLAKVTCIKSGKYAVVDYVVVWQHVISSETLRSTQHAPPWT